MSEGQTWSSEDTRLLVFKVFFGAGSQLHLLTVVTQRTDSCRLSEAERIVFAAEGLFLAHDFPFYCGIRLNKNVLPRKQRKFAPHLREFSGASAKTWVFG